MLRHAVQNTRSSRVHSGAQWIGDAPDGAQGRRRRDNAIHLDRMPSFDYDTLFWGERQLRSVTNMTRADARDFLAVVREAGIRPRATRFSLEDMASALQRYEKTVSVAPPSSFRVRRR